MRNIVIGVFVAILVIFGIYTILDYNQPKDTEDDTMGTTENSEPFVRDDFGEKYDIDNMYFQDSTSDEVYSLIDEGETFIVFIGRET